MKKYKVIYADPPWAYKVWSKKGAGRSAESHYPTMDIAAIKALPVGELADKDCALFLWITFPMLREAWGVMDAWGFTYRTLAFSNAIAPLPAYFSPRRFPPPAHGSRLCAAAA